MKTATMEAFESARDALRGEIQRSTVAGEWMRTQKLAQYASELDKIISGLDLGINGATRNGGFPLTSLERPAPPQVATHGNRALPYHFVSGNSLSKIGPSRDGSTYQHNVVRSHYDQIVGALVQLAKSRREFETHELTARCDVPAHEPLIVLAAFEQAGLLIKYRRGRYAFVDSGMFEQAAGTVWDKLSRG
jgi:hypothetical protein